MTWAEVPQRADTLRVNTIAVQSVKEGLGVNLVVVNSGELCTPLCRVSQSRLCIAIQNHKILESAEVVLAEAAELVLEIAVIVGRLQFRVLGQAYRLPIHDSLSDGNERVPPDKPAAVCPLVGRIKLVNDANESVQTFGLPEDLNQLLRVLLFGAPIEGPYKPRIKQVATRSFGVVREARQQAGVQMLADRLYGQVISTCDRISR